MYELSNIKITESKSGMANFGNPGDAYFIVCKLFLTLFTPQTRAKNSCIGKFGKVKCFLLDRSSFKIIHT